MVPRVDLTTQLMHYMYTITCNSSVNCKIFVPVYMSASTASQSKSSTMNSNAILVTLWYVAPFILTNQGFNLKAMS